MPLFTPAAAFLLTVENAVERPLVLLVGIAFEGALERLVLVDCVEFVCDVLQLPLAPRDGVHAGHFLLAQQDWHSLPQRVVLSAVAQSQHSHQRLLILRLEPAQELLAQILDVRVLLDQIVVA